MKKGGVKMVQPLNFVVLLVEGGGGGGVGEGLGSLCLFSGFATEIHFQELVWKIRGQVQKGKKNDMV